MTAELIKFRIWEDSGISLMSRVSHAGSNVQQADISSIAYSVYDMDDPTTPVNTGALTVADVIFDALQTDDRWSADSTGYNFRWDIAASEFPTGNKTYRIEIAFTPATGEVFHIVAEAEVIALMRS